jgi:hypothetical protein
VRKQAQTILVAAKQIEFIHLIFRTPAALSAQHAFQRGDR